jgi:hypothetical protein
MSAFCRWRQYVYLKRWYLFAHPHGITAWKTNNDVTAKTVSDVTYWNKGEIFDNGTDQKYK